MANIKTKFKNANEAYEYFLKLIPKEGIEFSDTKALFNIGFEITNPLDNKIKNKKRKWKHDYAEAEWQWYLSGDPNIKALENIYGKVPKIWCHMADEKGRVQSNYGWQWMRGQQLNNIVAKLKSTQDTRHGAISIYDAKEMRNYDYDTPCTYAVQFTIINNKLCMSVYMRSNDLWYGFCNDQYCFSMLQKLVADRMNMQVGEYYHYAHNLHLYNDKI